MSITLERFHGNHPVIYAILKYRWKSVFIFVIESRLSANGRANLINTSSAHSMASQEQNTIVFQSLFGSLVYMYT